MVGKSPHNDDRQEAPSEKPTFIDQVKREDHRDERSSKVYRDNCAGPVYYYRNDILHPEKGHHPLRLDLVGRKVRHRYIDVASHEREKKQKEDIPSVDSYPLVSISQDADFDQNDQKKEKKKEDEQKGHGQWKIMHRFLPLQYPWNRAPIPRKRNPL